MPRSSPGQFATEALGCSSTTPARQAAASRCSRGLGVVTPPTESVLIQARAEASGTWPTTQQPRCGRPLPRCERSRSRSTRRLAAHPQCATRHPGARSRRTAAHGLTRNRATGLAALVTFNVAGPNARRSHHRADRPRRSASKIQVLHPGPACPGGRSRQHTDRSTASALLEPATSGSRSGRSDPADAGPAHRRVARRRSSPCGIPVVLASTRPS